MVPIHRHAQPGHQSVPRASGDGPQQWADIRIPALCSPRERGWSPTAHPRPTVVRVFPARAGMVPHPARTTRRPGRVPRASGDGPFKNMSSIRLSTCSPRERGWSHQTRMRVPRLVVFPARAGMVPWRASLVQGGRGVPRASGDGPESSHSADTRSPCSPRERGWSNRRAAWRATAGVFPARAGMVPPRRESSRRPRCVPRASGDGPQPQTAPADTALCSPRERGWSRSRADSQFRASVFPARAGMVLRTPSSWTRTAGVPRASGDGPRHQASTSG